MRAALASLLLAAALPAVGQSSPPQSFPARPVHLIVPSAPGGGLDVVSRLVGNQLSETWKQAVIVENKPGAAMAIGADYVAKAAPDGYTVLFVNDGGLVVGPLTTPNVPFTSKNFAPVAQWVATPLLVLVTDSFPARSMGELLAYLRANPGKSNMAISDNNSLLAAELFKSLARVDFVNVLYKGGAPAASAVQSGEAQFTFAETVSGLAAVRGGKVRLIAVTTAQRVKRLPEAPTIGESGVAGFSVGTWGGMLAPAGTPREVVMKINADTKTALAVPAVTQKIESFGIDIQTGSPEDFARLIESDVEKYSRIIKDRNLKFQ